MTDYVEEFQALKLGKLAPRFDPRTVKLSAFTSSAINLPELPPATSRYTGRVELNMFANDKVGDCAFAGQGNAEEFWNNINGREVEIFVDDVLKEYSRVTGYNADDPNSDQGTVLLDALNNWRKNGMASHKINLYAAIELADIDLVKRAIWQFDGVYIGVALPASAQGQPNWEVIPDVGSQSNPGSWGGHCVFILDYDADGVIVATWGTTLRMSWDFWLKYVDEAYALESIDSLNSGKTYDGFDSEDLANALAAIKDNPASS